MAVAKETSSASDWQKKESFGSAMIQIAIVGALLAGGVFYMYQRGASQKNAADGLRDARVAALRDNPKDLNAALTKVEELLQGDRTRPLRTGDE